MQRMGPDSSTKTQGGENHSPNLSRRFFLKAAGGVATMLGLGVVGKVLKRKDLLRPPGGQDEASFLAKCLRCDRCRSICPTTAIGVAHVEDSFLDARTPMMKFHLGYCIFCRKCIEVCPTQALAPVDIKTVKIGLATVHTDRCIAWTFGGCTVCHAACPYQAISLDQQRRPVVDPSRCNGCGQCVKACPALVVRTYIGGTVRGIEVEPISSGGLL